MAEAGPGPFQAIAACVCGQTHASYVLCRFGFLTRNCGLPRLLAVDVAVDDEAGWLPVPAVVVSLAGGGNGWYGGGGSGNN